MSAERASVRSTRRRSDLWLLVAGLVVAVICAIVVRDGSLSDPERSVFLWINGLPDWLETPLWVVQLGGALVFVLCLAAGALLLRRRQLAVGIVAMVPAKLAVEWLVVKSLVERERPSFTVAEAVVREESSSLLGFPSGHAILAFAVAVIIAPYAGAKTRWVMLVAALGVGLARVYLAAHNPLDVVAGAGLGIALGSVWNLAIGVPGPPNTPPDDVNPD